MYSEFQNNKDQYIRVMSKLFKYKQENANENGSKDSIKLPINKTHHKNNSFLSKFINPQETIVEIEESDQIETIKKCESEDEEEEENSISQNSPESESSNDVSDRYHDSSALHQTSTDQLMRKINRKVQNLHTKKAKTKSNSRPSHLQTR